MNIDDFLKNVSVEQDIVPFDAFVRATGHRVRLYSVDTENGEPVYFDDAHTKYDEKDISIPSCNCHMNDSFNTSGNAVFARDKATDRRIAVEPVDDNGFTFYRDRENNVYSLFDLVLTNEKVSGKPVFGTLADRMLYYRAKPEQRIPKNSYVLIMLDGKNFSQKVKKKFKLPYDDTFIRLMNETAAYVCSKVQGAKFAYTQSDEISIFLTDADSPKSTLFFDGRIVKMLSVIATEATSYFNREIDKYVVRNKYPQWDGNGEYTEPQDRVISILDREPLYQFDCKVWTVPTLTEVWNWFLYRSRDCSRNSRQQAAQTYLSPNKLKNRHTEEQIRLLREKKGIDWHTAYNDGEKYGRYIIKVHEGHSREFKGRHIPYERSVWKPVYGRDLDAQDGREWFWQTLIEPLGITERDQVNKTFSDLLTENKTYCDKLLKNLSYLSDLSEQFPDAVDTYSENLIDNQYSDVKEMILWTDTILSIIRTDDEKDDTEQETK